MGPSSVQWFSMPMKRLTRRVVHALVKEFGRVAKISYRLVELRLGNSCTRKYSAGQRHPMEGGATQIGVEHESAVQCCITEIRVCEIGTGYGSPA